MSLIRFLALLGAALLCGCATTGSPPRAASAPAPLILISIDGLRDQALEPGVTPTLQRLAQEGVRADGMTPSYPSLTFPNHYTLVTGLRPDHHGIIHNTMHEAPRGMFRITDPKAVTDAAWWGGEPIWVGAEKAGIPTATLSWPGSEAAIGGVRPTYWNRYDESVPISDRVAQVLAWLDPPPGQPRPRFLTLYMEHVDKAGHSYGPESPQYKDALAKVDRAIGELVDGLARKGMLETTNLMVVSDHGMATVRPDQLVAIEDMVAPELARLVSSGQSVGFAPRPGREAEAEARLLGRHDHYECWKKDALPARWRYGTHPRVPAIICQMDEGWDALPRAHLAERGARERGSHGYDPALPAMQAVFIARGPAFARNQRLPRVDNVDVYPLLAHLLGIAPAANDGNPGTLRKALR